MLTFRRPHRDDAPAVPAWAQAPRCAEFAATGIEIELIDLVERRERSARAGFADVAALDAEIAELRSELAALTAA